MTETITPFVTVGKIGKSYGIKGWLKIHAYTEFGASIFDYKPWYLSDNSDNWSSIAVEEGRLHGASIIVKLAGINSPEEARLLTGKRIGVHREQLPQLPKNQYYWSDLEGLTVVNPEGTALGIVSYLMATGSNDVLIIVDEHKKEHAIPYLPKKVILEVDLKKRTIVVDWELL